MKIKYVIVDDVYPILFTECHQHSQFKYVGGKPTSAGFCSVREIETPADRVDISSCTMFEVSVWGESVSLGLKSKPSDAIFIARMFNQS